MPDHLDSTSRSTIGRSFCESPRAALALAIAAVAADFLLVSWQAQSNVRASLAVVVFGLTISLTAGDHSSAGLRMTPRQGWARWCILSVRIGGLVGICVVVGLGIVLAAGYEFDIPVTAPWDVDWRLVQMCFVAPVVEETIYRLAACGLIAAICGNNRTIVLNGLLFGGLHVLYGNPSPENLVGGFFVARASLKSETILIPLLLHSIGNAIALTSQVVAWYLLNDIT